MNQSSRILIEAFEEMFFDSIKKNEERVAMNLLFKTFQPMLFDGNITMVDNVLGRLDYLKYPIKFLVGFLSATNPWKSELPNRQVLLNYTAHKIYKSYGADRVNTVLKDLRLSFLDEVDWFVDKIEKCIETESDHDDTDDVLCLILDMIENELNYKRYIFMNSVLTKLNLELYNIDILLNIWSLTDLSKTELPNHKIITDYLIKKAYRELNCTEAKSLLRGIE